MCLKRKVRNFVALTKGDAPGHEIFVAERAILELQQKRAWDAIIPRCVRQESREASQGPAEGLGDHSMDVCELLRCPGPSVPSCPPRAQTAAKCAARCNSPLLAQLTRYFRWRFQSPGWRRRPKPTRSPKAIFARWDAKHIVPYGLYRAHGYVSACLAGGKGTGFSEEDLELLWVALEQMFDHDRSAARGEMAARRLILFKHDGALGSAPAHRLFERVTVNRVFDGEEHEPRDRRAHNLPPARAYVDYAVHVDDENLPNGVEIIDRI